MMPHAVKGVSQGIRGAARRQTAGPGGVLVPGGRGATHRPPRRRARGLSRRARRPRRGPGPGRC